MKNLITFSESSRSGNWSEDMSSLFSFVKRLGRDALLKLPRFRTSSGCSYWSLKSMSIV